MPKTPEGGSYPGTHVVRNVPPTEFICTLTLDPEWAGVGVFPLASGMDAVSNPIDVLTPAYQGRGDSNAAVQNSPTRGLGSPGAGGNNPALEWRVPGVTLGGWVTARAPMSVRFRWSIWTVAAGERFVDTYEIRPVVSTKFPIIAGPLEQPHNIGPMMIPSPWFRVIVANKGAAALALDDFELFLWIRGG
jgi:hypothetical protein